MDVLTYEWLRTIACDDYHEERFSDECEAQVSVAGDEL